MKRIFRYFKWLFTGMGRFEWYLLSVGFFLGSGSMAAVHGDEQVRDIMFTIALVMVGIGLVTFMFKAIQFSWNRFKEDDEKVFNILRKENLNGK